MKMFQVIFFHSKLIPHEFSIIRFAASAEELKKQYRSALRIEQICIT